MAFVHRHASLDEYDVLSDISYLDIARIACEFNLNDLPKQPKKNNALCISYVPDFVLEINNSNMLTASLLSRVYYYTKEAALGDIAHKAVKYKIDNQHPDGSWYFGEVLLWHWIDGYHAGFVLDSLYWYIKSTGDEQYIEQLIRGMD